MPEATGLVRVTNTKTFKDLLNFYFMDIKNKKDEVLIE